MIGTEPATDDLAYSLARAWIAFEEAWTDGDYAKEVAARNKLSHLVGKVEETTGRTLLRTK